MTASAPSAPAETAPAVTVIVDGRIVGGISAARLVNGRIVAPVAPYADAIATADAPAGDGYLRISAGRRTLLVHPDVFGRVTLAAVARALGERVAYDPLTRTLAIETAPTALEPFRPSPIRSPAGPNVDLGAADGAMPTPKPSVDGIPRPRRTPIEAGSPDDGP